MSLQFCEICSKPFRTLNLNHLRTHGILTWDQYSVECARRSKPDQTLIQDVVGGLLANREISEEHQQKLATIYSARQRNAPGICSTMELRQMLRLTKLFQVLDEAEEVTYSKAQLAKLTFEQMMNLMSFVSGDIKSILAQMSDSVGKKGLGFAGAVEQLVGNQFNFNMGGAGTEFDSRLPANPRAQVALMGKVDEMYRRLKSGENPAQVIETVATHVSNEPATAGVATAT